MVTQQRNVEVEVAPITPTTSTNQQLIGEEKSRDNYDKDPSIEANEDDFYASLAAECALKIEKEITKKGSSNTT